jgi:hypothetical protein
MSVKISELSASSGLSSTDILPVVDASQIQTQKATFQQVLDYVTGSTFNSLTVTNLTGSTVTGSTALFTTVTASNIKVSGDLNISGTLTAREYHTQVVSASIIYESGSTKFGNDSGDTHQFSGSILLSGTLSANNTISGTTAQFNIVSASVISASSYIGVPSTVPGGSDQSVQFNSGSTFSGSTNLIYNYTTNTLSGTTAQFTTVSASTAEISGNIVIYGSASLAEYPDYAYVLYTASLDKIVVYPGLYVSGNLTGSGHAKFNEVSGTTAQFTTVSASVISASQYVGLTAGNVTGTGTSSRLAYWLGTNNIGEVSEISYVSPSPGNGSRINWNNSGQGITFDMSTNAYNSSIFLQGAGAGSVEIYQNASTYYGGASGISFSAPGPVIRGAMGLQIKTVDNPFVTSELTIAHEVPSGGFTRTLMKTSYNSGVLINPNGNNDFNFRVNGNGGSALLLGDTSTNRIGINKTSPNAQLDVNGNTIISGNLTVTGTVSASNYLGIPTSSFELTKLIVSSSVSLSPTERAVFAKNNISSSLSVTLPSASLADSKEYYIIKADSVSGSVIISGSSPNLINGQSTFELNGPHQSVTLIHDGTDWYVF